MSDILNYLVKSINTAVDNKTANLGFDRTRIGYVVSKNSDFCEIVIDSRNFTKVPVYGDIGSIEVGKMAKVIYPCNQVSQMYVLAPPKSGGSGSEFWNLSPDGTTLTTDKDVQTSGDVYANAGRFTDLYIRGEKIDFSTLSKQWNEPNSTTLQTPKAVMIDNSLTLRNPTATQSLTMQVGGDSAFYSTSADYHVFNKTIVSTGNGTTDIGTPIVKFRDGYFTGKMNVGSLNVAGEDIDFTQLGKQWEEPSTNVYSANKQVQITNPVDGSGQYGLVLYDSPKTSSLLMRVQGTAAYIYAGGDTTALILNKTLQNNSGSTYDIGTLASPWRNIIASTSVIVGDGATTGANAMYLQPNGLVPRQTNATTLGTPTSRIANTHLSGRLNLYYSADASVTGYLTHGSNGILYSTSGNFHQFNASAIPLTAGNLDLGTETLPWNNVYANNYYLNGQLIDFTKQWDDSVPGFLSTDRNVRILNNYLTVFGPSGKYIRIGSDNTNYAHFITDATEYYFNKGLTIQGDALPYTDATYSLGSSARAWKDGFFSGNLSAKGDIISNGAIYTARNGVTTTITSQSSTLTHILTDASSGFYFNSRMYINGSLYSYTDGSNDLGEPSRRWRNLYLVGDIYRNGTALSDTLLAKADLVDGLVPISQLPDHLASFQSYPTKADFPATGTANVIYFAEDTELQYRWSGSEYVQMLGSLVLGETADTAYRGDRGKIAYDHSQLTAGNPHNTTKANVGLGNVDNTSDINKPISTAVQTALNGKANTVHTHSATDITSGILPIETGGTNAGSVPDVLRNFTIAGVKNVARRISNDSPWISDKVTVRGSYTDKLWFHDINRINCEISDDDITYTDFAVTDANKRALVAGRGQIQSSILWPKGKYLRITINAEIYCILSELIIHMSSTGASQSYRFERYVASTDTWIEVFPYTNATNGWPGTISIPFTPFAFRTGVPATASKIRLTVYSTNDNNPAYPDSYLYGLEIHGGYQFGVKQEIYTWDSSANMFFPNALLPKTTTTQDIGSTISQWRNGYFSNNLTATTLTLGSTIFTEGDLGKQWDDSVTNTLKTPKTVMIDNALTLRDTAGTQTLTMQLGSDSVYYSTSVNYHVFNKTIIGNSTVDIGTTAVKFRDAYFSGTVNSNILSLVNNGITSTIASENTNYLHFRTNSTQGFYFNKAQFIQGHVFPYTSLIYDIGSTGQRWRRVYANYLNINGTDIDFSLLAEGQWDGTDPNIYSTGRDIVTGPSLTQKQSTNNRTTVISTNASDVSFNTTALNFNFNKPVLPASGSDPDMTLGTTNTRWYQGWFDSADITYLNATYTTAFNVVPNTTGVGNVGLPTNRFLNGYFLNGYFDNINLGPSNIQITATPTNVSIAGDLSVTDLKVAGKSIVDTVYPLGAIYISSTNASPATNFGGVWELVYKKRKDISMYSTGTGIFSRNTTNVSGVTDSGLQITNNVAKIFVNFVNAVAITDSALTLGNLNLATIGIPDVPPVGSGTFSGAVSGWTDAGNAMLMLTISSADGRVQSVDRVPATSVPVGSSCWFETTIALRWSDLSDSICDEWHWRRIE